MIQSFKILIPIAIFIQLSTQYIGKIKLNTWMQQTMPLIGDLNLLDITLPGSHDSMTYDLSNTISMRANDINPELAYILNKYGNLFPGIEDFIREQAQSQTLDIIQQLDSGLRFIDFRIIYTRDPKKDKDQEWYCLHLVQSNNHALTYLQQVRDWMDRNPQEILVMAFTRHGNFGATGEEQYPNVTNQVKQQFWDRVKLMFEPLLFNTSKNSLNETSIKQLVDTNQRLIIYAGDYSNFTGNDPLALNAQLIDNELGGGLDNIEEEIDNCQNAQQRKIDGKKKNIFWLRSLASGVNTAQIEYSLIRQFVGPDEELLEKCKKIYKFPNNQYCPLNLLDIGAWTNFYNQKSFDYCSNNGLQFSNAFYIDQIGMEGTLNVGIQNGKQMTYGVVWAIILSNLRIVCRNSTSDLCDDLLQQIDFQSNAIHNSVYWNDKEYGRIANFPV